MLNYFTESMTDNEITPLISERDASDTSLHQSIAWKYYILLPIVTLTCTAVGLEFYTSTQWIQDYVKKEMFHNAVNTTSLDGCKAINHSDPDYITFEKVQSTSADWQLYKNVAGCIPAFLLIMVLPSLSDSYGRRFLFIVGITGQLLQMLFESVTVYFKLDLHYFVAGSFVAGLFGNFYSVTSASYSYIADITKDGRLRTFGYTSFDSLLLGCYTLSGLACGYIITYKGFLFPIVTSAIILFVALILTILFLPETHEEGNRTKNSNICKTLNRTIDFYRSSNFRGRRVAYILLILAYFFEEISTFHRSSLEMIFQLGMPLCWPAKKVGIFTAIRHASQVLAGIIFIVPLKACLSELSIAIWSTLFNAGSFVMEGLVQTDLTMYLVSLPATFSFLTVPMIKSILSMMTPADKQGSLFASVSAVQSICGILANLVLNLVYSATVSFMAGFVFIVLAGVCFIVFMLLSVFGLTQKEVYQPSALGNKVSVQISSPIE